MLWSLLLACSTEPAPAPSAPAGPDVLLITIDTLRADRVGCYGDGLASTPAIDGLAAGGALFREAHVTVPLTLPSHASILTGLLPAHHGLRDNAGFRLQDDVPTLAQAMSAAGYQTAAFVSAYVLDSAWGLDRGFDTYRDPFHPEDVGRVGAFGEVELPGAEVVNAAIGWWKGHASPEDEPQPRRFAWVHLYSPHTPWAPHSDWKGDPYRGEVAAADELVAKLLSKVDDDALVIITSDHGEGLWDHGERQHGVLLGRNITHVPLVIRPPGGVEADSAPPPRRPEGDPVSQRPEGVDPSLFLAPVPDQPVAALVVPDLVSSIDIAPTIADYAGATLVADGRSLRPLLEGGTLDPRPVYAETWFPLFHYGWAGLRMVQDDTTRLEIGARTTAIDWITDPTGAHPHEPDDGAAPLLALADADQGEGAPQPGPIDSQTAAALQALGYVTAPAAPPTDAPDPRDQVQVLSQLQAADALDDVNARVSALQVIVRDHPDMADARISLSLARAESGDPRGALEDSMTVLQRWPDHPTALANAALLSHTLHEDDQALSLAHHMQVLNPQDPRAYRIQAAVGVGREDAQLVLQATQAGLAIAPDDPNLHYLLALALIQTGAPEQATEHLLAAREHGSHATDIDLWLGIAEDRQGHVDAALAHYKDAATTGDLRPSAMAGWMLYKAGRCPEALPLLVNVARRGGGADPKVSEALNACKPQHTP